MGAACSNMACTVVMEEGCQKSKRLSYTAKFKRDVVRCTEIGNCKAAAIFWTDDSNVQLWWKHKAVISECEVSQQKFTGPKKEQYPENDNEVFSVLSRYARLE
jgi:hypothetical protein